ncbi:MAG: hypothetical protein M0P12_00460 [Paludibacteraceae bacterium]|nr:hypothetical protein [Paludibacteraceae bacterium]
MDKIWKDSFETDRFEIVCGDSLQKLKNIPSSSVSSICCDPPYGLGKQPDPIEVMKDWVEKGYHEITGKGFMGKEWDAFVPQPNLWKGCLRVLKPGGHLLSFCRNPHTRLDGDVFAICRIRNQRYSGMGVCSGFPEKHGCKQSS